MVIEMQICAEKDAERDADLRGKGRRFTMIYVERLKVFGGLEVVSNSDDGFVDGGSIKVNEQSKSFVEQTEVSQYLFVVNQSEVFHRLNFYNHEAFNQDIKPEPDIKLNSLILHRDTDLAFNKKPGFS